MKRVSRLVVRPDYQGIGVGKILLDYIGKLYRKDGFRYTITTSNVALMYSLKKDKKWRLKSYGRKPFHTSLSFDHLKRTGSAKRLTSSWELYEV